MLLPHCQLSSISNIANPCKSSIHSWIYLDLGWCYLHVGVFHSLILVVSEVVSRMTLAGFNLIHVNSPSNHPKFTRQSPSNHGQVNMSQTSLGPQISQIIRPVFLKVRLRIQNNPMDSDVIWYLCLRTHPHLSIFIHHDYMNVVSVGIHSIYPLCIFVHPGNLR